MPFFFLREALEVYPCGHNLSISKKMMYLRRVNKQKAGSLGLHQLTKVK
jgi:hypothetical protein